MRFINKDNLLNKSNILICEQWTGIVERPIEYIPCISIDRIKNEPEIEDMYENGYNQALKDINTEMKMITENWKSSKCPRCLTNFHDYEDCDDGYYNRAYGLERCPFCGQKIKWS